jgi:NAD(P)-dependent dehydrogenase (short-subunit alcohol dehydrogenase family)
MSAAPVAVIFGARNVGRAVAHERRRSGWQVVAAARTRETLVSLSATDEEIVTLSGDARSPDFVADVFARASGLGAVGLVVNAITAPPRDQSFGGGPIADAPADRLASWLDGFVPMAWAIQRQAARILGGAGRGTVVQVAGGSARRGFAGRGPWAAAQFAVRGLTQSLAAEMRPQGVHAALLIADGYIETERRPLGEGPPEGVLHPGDVAAGVAYLAAQSPRAWTHELVLTPSAEDWAP